MAHPTPLARSAAILTCVAALFACDRARGQDVDAPFEVVAQWPHDSQAYTQGLIWDDSVLLESTGSYGRSDLRRVDLATGRVLASTPLAANRFGEGLARMGSRLFQLTWESNIGYIYDAETLAPIDSFTYAGEGWGLTTDGVSLIMSDGSDSIRYMSPETFVTERSVHVKHQGNPLRKLNELEFVNGDILANVYETDWLARIDPATGVVTQLLDFASLYPKGNRPYGTDVFNGIAVGPDSGTLLVTGKMWPVLFTVRLKKPAVQ